MLMFVTQKGYHKVIKANKVRKKNQSKRFRRVPPTGTLTTVGYKIKRLFNEPLQLI